mgnify:CR=1 FL=1
MIESTEQKAHSRNCENVSVAGTKTQDGGRGSGEGTRHTAGDTGWVHEVIEQREDFKQGARQGPMGPLTGSFSQKCGEQGG